MCRNNSSCVDNIDNAVALFNDKVVTLVNNFNNNLTNAKFIYINTTEISLSSSSSEGKILFISFPTIILLIVLKF